MDFISKLSEVARLMKLLKHWEDRENDEKVDQLTKKIESYNCRDLLYEVVEKYENANPKMGVIISHYTLRNYLGEKLSELIKATKDLKQLHVNIFGLKYDNYSTIYLSDIYGHLYSLVISETQITLYDDRGTTFLCRVSFEKEEFNNKHWNDLAESMKKYQKGYKKCADCGEWMSEEQIGGRYFAGLYCNEKLNNCWKGNGWREIEAKETYA